MSHTDGCVGMSTCLCVYHQYKTCAFNKAGNEAAVNGLVLDCRGDWRVAHSGVEIMEWLIAGNINCQSHLQL